MGVNSDNEEKMEKQRINKGLQKDYYSMKIEDVQPSYYEDFFNHLQIGVFGTGDFGQALGKRLQSSGFPIFIGSR